jgi:hypothetical protein
MLINRVKRQICAEEFQINFVASLPFRRVKITVDCLGLSLVPGTGGRRNLQWRNIRSTCIVTSLVGGVYPDTT